MLDRQKSDLRSLIEAELEKRRRVREEEKGRAEEQRKLKKERRVGRWGCSEVLFGTARKELDYLKKTGVIRAFHEAKDVLGEVWDDVRVDVTMPDKDGRFFEPPYGPVKIEMRWHFIREFEGDARWWECNYVSCGCYMNHWWDEQGTHYSKIEGLNWCGCSTLGAFNYINDVSPDEINKRLWENIKGSQRIESKVGPKLGVRVHKLFRGQ